MLLTIINDILDLSKMEAGRFDLDNVDFNAHEIVEEVSRLLEPQARAKGLAFLTEVADDIDGLSHGDPARLHQIIINLVGNAIKFTDEGSVAIRIAPSSCGSKSRIPDPACLPTISNGCSRGTNRRETRRRQGTAEPVSDFQFVRNSAR